jgi:hypothetical protein
VLVLRARGGAQSDLGRGGLLLMMRMLSRGRDGQWSRGCSVGRLWRAWASAASGARPTTPPLLAGTGSVSGFIFTVVLVLFGRCGRAADGQPTWDIVGTRSRHAHRPRRAADGCADGHGRWQGAVRSVEACLDKILPFGLGDEGLELCGGESIDQTSL